MKNMRQVGTIVWLLAGGLAYGGSVSQRSIADLGQSADMIVIGSASGGFKAGSTPGFSISVTRVVKGQATPGTALWVQWTSGVPLESAVLPPGADIAVSGAGIWFLQSSQGGWSLLPLTQGRAPLDRIFIPTPSQGAILAAYAYAETAALQTKLALEVCSAIESESGSYSQQVYWLLRGDLDTLNSPAVPLLYQRLSAATSPQQQALGLSGLIRGGNGSALALASGTSQQFSHYPIEYGILLTSVRNEFRAADSLSIAALGQAALGSASQGSSFREAAAHALAAIHSTSTLPYLATLLGDPDATLRVEAVGGLGAFANGYGIQTPANVASMSYLQRATNAPYQTPDTMAHFAMGSVAIEQNETWYVSFWQTWWQQNRASLGF